MNHEYLRIIDIRVQALSKEEELKMKNALFQVIFQIYRQSDIKGEKLNLAKLKKIVITDDYENDVSQISHGADGITKNDISKGRAKNIHDENNNVTVAFDYEIIKLIFDKAEDERYWAFYLIHHELCHVHDHFLKLQHFGDIYKKPHLYGENRYFTELAMTVWSEYFAVKYSSGTARGHIVENYTGALVETLDSYSQCLDAIRGKHAESCNFGGFFNDFWRKANFIFTQVAYLHGFLSWKGIGAKDVILFPGEDQEISLENYVSGSVLKGAWVQIGECLEQLDASYMRWNGLENFEGVIKGIDTFLQNSNVTIKYLDDGSTFINPLRYES